MSAHYYSSDPPSFHEPLLARGDPCIPPSSTEDSLSRCRAPPPSPVLCSQRICGFGKSCSPSLRAMPTVDEQFGNHAERLSKSSGPGHEGYTRRKTLSVDASPLHQVSSAEDDFATLTASGPLSPASSDTNALLADGSSKSRVIPTALILREMNSRDDLTWSQPISEISPPVSPPLSESSLSSTTPLFPGRLRNVSHQYSNLSEPRPSAMVSQISPSFPTTSMAEMTAIPRVSKKRISSPIVGDSSIEARIRPSSIYGIDVAMKPLLPTVAPASAPAKATKPKSWPKRQHRAKTSEIERKEAASVNAQSRFSDDEDDDASKSLGSIFGYCFRGRKV